MTTTFRYDLISAIKDTLDDYIHDNPATLKHAYRARPAGFVDFPCVYIGTRTETIAQDVSTRRRDFRVDVVLVDMVTENEEALGRLDPLVDGLLDAFTAAFRSIPNAGPLDIKSVAGGEIPPAEAGAGIYAVEGITLSGETEEGTGH